MLYLPSVAAELPAQEMLELWAISGLPGSQQWEMQTSWENRALPKPVMVTACQKRFPIAGPEGDISVRGDSLHSLHGVTKGSSLLEANYPLDLGSTAHMASEVIPIPTPSLVQGFLPCYK